MIDFTALCATIEDLTQVLAYSQSGVLDADVCRLENAFSLSRVVMGRSPLREFPSSPWKLENVACDAYGGTVSVAPSSVQQEAVRRFRSRATSPVSNMSVSTARSSRRVNNIDVSCIALRIDQLSGISFNQFCTRRPV